MIVLVADPIEEPGLELLRDAGHDVTELYDADSAELRETVAGAHALIVRSGTTVDAGLLDAADDLVIVGRAGIGTDNIDEEAATERGIIVANAPGGNVRAAAEHTIAMTFAVARSIPQAHIRLREGEWAKTAFQGTELNDRTLGIVGVGRVGMDVARKLNRLGMDLVAYDPYIPVERAEQLGAELVDLDTCLQRADFLSVHTPLTPETEGMIGEEELGLLGDGYLINCARGGIVDEDALARAVTAGKLRGAAIDVFAEEPLPADSPLLEVDDIVVTPHLGAKTETAQRAVATEIATQVNAALAGEPVTTALNAPSVDPDASPELLAYMELAETAGRVAAQLLETRMDRVEVHASGGIGEEDGGLLTAYALMGACQAFEWRTTPVNARRVAEERGIEVYQRTESRTRDFSDLVRVVASSDGGSIAVEGTLFEGEEPRLVRIDGYRVDAIPHGHMLVVRNRDAPGVIGYIGTALGEREINIAGMFNSRETQGGEALTVYNLDEAVPADLLAELVDDGRIFDARYITLN